MSESYRGGYRGGVIWGGLLILLGVVFLLQNVLHIEILWSVVWPLCLIAVGLSMILSPKRRG